MQKKIVEYLVINRRETCAKGIPLSALNILHAKKWDGAIGRAGGGQGDWSV